MKVALPVPASQWARSAADCIGEDFLDLAVAHFEGHVYVPMTQRETIARDELTREIETAISNYVRGILRTE